MNVSPPFKGILQAHNVQGFNKLANKTLLAKALQDLESPDGKFVVEIVSAGKEGFFAESGEYGLSVTTQGAEETSPKSIAAVLLNMDSKEFKQEFKGVIRRKMVGLSFSQEAMLQTLREVARNQARLVINGEAFMKRGDYFALRDQAI